MASYTGVIYHPISAYHRNTSLLLQFILIEFITAQQQIQYLTKLCHLQPASPIPNHDVHYLKQQINNILYRLAGASHGQRKLADWGCSEGLLAKLKAYCMVFIQSCDGDEKELIGMQHYIDKAWQHALTAYTSFNSIKPDPSFLSSLTKIDHSMSRFAKHISKIILSFHEDENIVYFILTHHTQLDAAIQPRFVYKLFSRMFPKGLYEASQFLKTKYSARGFSNMMQSIDSQITELQEVSG